jgi:hypothetical protein
MFSEQWTKVLGASVTPVVVISATSLLCLAFYNRLAAIVGRLRSVQRERLEVQENLSTMSQPDIERFSALRQSCILESLTEQTIRIKRRARFIRATLLCFLTAIAFLVMSSLMTGLTVLWPSAVIGAALMFTFGMALLLVGVGFAWFEMLVALHPAELETEVVSGLTGEEQESQFDSGNGKNGHKRIAIATR